MHPGFLLVNEPHSLLPLAESPNSTLFLWVSTPLPEWVIAIYWLIVSIVTRPHVTWWHNTLSDTMEQTGVDQSDKNNETLMKLLRYYIDLKLQNWYNGGQLYVTIQSMLSWWTSAIHVFGFCLKSLWKWYMRCNLQRSSQHQNILKSKFRRVRMKCCNNFSSSWKVMSLNFSVGSKLLGRPWQEWSELRSWVLGKS